MAVSAAGPNLVPLLFAPPLRFLHNLFLGPFSDVPRNPYSRGYLCSGGVEKHGKPLELRTGSSHHPSAVGW